MRLLFVKARLEWPRTYGHDVHCYEMMRALAELGHTIGLATDDPSRPEATEGIALAGRWILAEEPAGTERPRLSYWQERYRSYWGIAAERIAALKRISQEWRADAVIVVGLEILPYLAGPEGVVRVWYAADEWVWHYASQLAADPRNLQAHVKAAAIKGVYERVFSPLMDRVWVVSRTEQRAMRIVAGARHVDVLPNGVDTTRFAPMIGDALPASACFWGRLGFGPNLQALRWFCHRVWPRIRAEEPNATFGIFGADPPAEIAALHGRDGMHVVANAEDLRPHIARHLVVTLPFVSGGGIKNKLLEAASLAKPIVATTRAVQGLRTAAPVELADTPSQFASAVLGLWRAPHQAAELGLRARRWVESDHGWARTAADAAQSIAASIPARFTPPE
jgi:glycosyltransferase involved in cell wall biosynthesis